MDSRYMATWAITTLGVVDRDLVMFDRPHRKIVEFIEREFAQPELGSQAGRLEKLWNRHLQSAALLVGYYLRQPWTDDQLELRVKDARFHTKELRDSLTAALANAR